MKPTQNGNTRSPVSGQLKDDGGWRRHNIDDLDKEEEKRVCLLIHLCRVDSSTTTLSTSLFPIKWCVVSLSYYYVLRFAVSDLGLHYMPVTLLGVSRLKWVNKFTSLPNISFSDDFPRMFLCYSFS